MSEQHYLVTARKYRPQVFADLVAQDHVSATLKNAISLNRLAHLYLFSGPRGVGKTTAARILAKAINCLTPASERVDGTEPCRTCDSCKAFEEGRSLSIFEIDAASNNKAEDMRELRDTVRIPPQGGKKKVYIVDEVHMLSTAAFNVLLKTLEEPPPYVLFIFATTEPHKVLPTILSRCQRFDFRRIPVDEIVPRLREICEQENISADDASLMLIARKGDGALRDALSVFDQAVALCGDNLVYDELSRALGVVDVDVFFDVTDAAVRHDSGSMLRIVDDIVRSGHDFQEFLSGLAEHLRSLLVGATTKNSDLIEGIEAVKKRYMEVAETLSEQDLLRMLMIVAGTETEIRSSTHPRLRLELALLKIAALTSAVDLRAVLRSIESGEAPKVAPAAPPPPASPKTAPSAEKAPRPAEERSTSAAPPTARPDDPVRREPEPSVQRTASQEPMRGATNAEPDVRSRVFSEPALKRRRPGGQEPEAVATGDAADVEVAEPEPVITIPVLRVAWEEATAEVGRERIRLAALMKQSRPRSADGSGVVLEVPSQYHRQELDGLLDVVRDALSAALEAPIRTISIIVAEDEAVDGDSETARPADPYELLNRLRNDNEVLRSLFEDFGGEYSS
jgi:DNA polymerase III subunit gamma/tau